MHYRSYLSCSIYLKMSIWVSALNISNGLRIKICNKNLSLSRIGIGESVNEQGNDGDPNFVALWRNGGRNSPLSLSLYWSKNRFGWWLRGADRRPATGTICRGMCCVSHVYAAASRGEPLFRNAVLSSRRVRGTMAHSRRLSEPYKNRECVTTLEWQVIQQCRISRRMAALTLPTNRKPKQTSSMQIDYSTSHSDEHEPRPLILFHWGSGRG